MPPTEENLANLMTQQRRLGHSLGIVSEDPMH
jgi:hypothetical protein